MKQFLDRYIKLVIIISFTLILVQSCYINPNQNTGFPTAELARYECKIIKHPLGKSCIPPHPQRVIVTDQESLEILVALGIKPVGAAQANIVGSKARLFAGIIDEITYLGKESQPNIEKMVQLHPDLILGFGVEKRSYIQI